ncbi:alpha/beta-hydrolase [Podospora fimiseda]|uniref:Alpha/beta-hydrolase n=1 Tax=Podospora fimiseda TaxID=252190 RepID=A0AAN7H2Q5_9PEZI|nr:alpha/beta-hydrolase [Podospora fimiseda]
MASTTILFLFFCFFFLSLTTSTTATPPHPSPHNSNNNKQKPITLLSSGGFQIGGQKTINPLNSSETLTCDHAYVEYFFPARPRKLSFLLWHSSSTQLWQNRWDGGPGYKDLLLRRGYPVYLWDGPRVGRANWGCESYLYEPHFGIDELNFVNWNFGEKFKIWYDDGVQFPVDDEEAWIQATSARYAEFDVFENVKLQSEVMAKAVDQGKLGEEIVWVTSSAGGFRAQLAGTLVSKDKIKRVKGLIAYESFGYVFPDLKEVREEIGEIDEVEGFGPSFVLVERFKKFTEGLKFIQFVWGDHRSEDHEMVQMSKKCAEWINRFGGKAEVVMLREDAGLKGNTHLPFADLNNEEVLGLVEGVLRREGLDGFV